MGFGETTIGFSGSEFEEQNSRSQGSAEGLGFRVQVLTFKVPGSRLVGFRAARL